MRCRKSGVRARLMIWRMSSLPPVSCGWALPGENELHRSVRVVDDGFQALDVAHEQSCAFVSGEAAGEANRQRVRVEHFVCSFDFVLRRAPALKLRPQAFRA
jgi:hypothetical protein